MLSSILHATHTKCSGCHTSPSAVIIYRIGKKEAQGEQESFYSFHFVCIFATILILWVQTLNLFLLCSLLNLQHISFNACQLVYVTCTFPTMHLLQEAQWPFAVVRTPILSKSELSPPSRSSIVSVFLLTVEAFASEPAVPLLLLSLFTCGPPSVFFFTDCFCLHGGGVVEDTGS